ncbi:methionine-R-sulfoxide reductase B1-like, partial [Lingula anatina]|uniref:peptide-methionine (R)-S-oxide reductase n=1 Tax=Lingula anatina TaxID=7574 RepID=A0A1S3I5C5_LINAN
KYVCSQCGYDLFHSNSKYAHATPWPAFTQPMRPDSLSKREESPRALKVSCGKCGNGLGHEFLGDGPKEGQNAENDEGAQLHLHLLDSASNSYISECSSQPFSPAEYKGHQLK